MDAEGRQNTAHPPAPSNRSVGALFAIVFLVVGLAPIVTAGRPRLWSLGLTVLFTILSLVKPSWLGPLNRLWMAFGRLLHSVISPIVLAAMFFVVVTPTGLLMRALGKDILRLRTDPNTASYWIPRIPPGPVADSLRNQF